MKTPQEHIVLRCAFCMSTQFALPYKGYSPHHGSLVVCANCGRENDFISLYLIGKKNVYEIAEKFAKNLVQKELKKALKGNKFIKFC